MPKELLMMLVLFFYLQPSKFRRWVFVSSSALGVYSPTYLKAAMVREVAVDHCGSTPRLRLAPSSPTLLPATP